MKWVDSGEERVTGPCEHGNKTYGFIKMAAICWLDERLLAGKKTFLHTLIYYTVSYLVI
jgi:hypothetical protein